MDTTSSSGRNSRHALRSRNQQWDGRKSNSSISSRPGPFAYQPAGRSLAEDPASSRLASILSVLLAEGRPLQGSRTRQIPGRNCNWTLQCCRRGWRIFGSRISPRSAFERRSLDQARARSNRKPKTEVEKCLPPSNSNSSQLSAVQHVALQLGEGTQISYPFEF